MNDLPPRPAASDEAERVVGEVEQPTGWFAAVSELVAMFLYVDLAGALFGSCAVALALVVGPATGEGSGFVAAGILVVALGLVFGVAWGLASLVGRLERRWRRPPSPNVLREVALGLGFSLTALPWLLACAAAATQELGAPFPLLVSPFSAVACTLQGGFALVLCAARLGRRG